MTDTMTKREYRAAVRADRDGSGPTLEERPAARFPGATGAFQLLGEVLVIGLLITIASLPVVTLPAALAAGIRHVRRFIAAEHAPIAGFWRDVLRGSLGGAVIGLVALVAVGVLLLDIDLARSGFLPGGIVIEVIGWAGLAAVGLGILLAAGAWTPETGWRTAVRGIPAAVRDDVVGTAFVVATAGFVVVVTWMLPPLFIAAIGCAALAVVAVPQRTRRTR
ncbi:hypothetical protein GCM10009775_16670 [Microbacterium aoyamense]|uniref:DUF624 domain-containing protein n=1 Tax=Microbacterium aoyamense TaxID=344166 RepID=A0ABN2PLH9_9MICO|nr:hypothetical protein [Microbacterium aoyamense]